jgi:hypothetical protein
MGPRPIEGRNKGKRKEKRRKKEEEKRRVEDKSSRCLHRKQWWLQPTHTYMHI